MNKLGRLSAMISSTAIDLPEHRRHVVDACLREDLFPIGMEQLPARDVTGVQASLDMVDKADVYIGIYAWRYGWVPDFDNPNRISITEMEFNRAVERKERGELKEILVFVMHEDHFIRARDKEDGAEAQEKLKIFKERAARGRVRITFSSSEELRGHVIQALAAIKRQNERVLSALNASGEDRAGTRHNIPFASNPFFTGRDELLQQLRESLLSKSNAAITQPQAVHGLGGVGKTQLAVEYAWRYLKDYDLVLWVASSSVTEFHSNLAGLATTLSLENTEESGQAHRIEAVVHWLRSHSRWLLIIDNVDTEDTEVALTDLLLPGLRGHIIVTSRRSNWPVTFADLEVSVLSEPAAILFLLSRAKKFNFDPGTDADALAVARELGCLPLALEQAGAYLAKHRENLKVYLGLLKTSRSKLLEFPSKGGTGYQRTVATTWLVSARQLSPTALIVLQLIAFFSSQNIPRNIFADSEAVLSKIDIQLSRETIQAAIVELHDHSLIILEPNVISCHRLLQAVLLDRLDPKMLEMWLQAATAIVVDALRCAPGVLTDWLYRSRLQPQIVSILNHQGPDSKEPAVPMLMISLAEVHQQMGAYNEAEILMREAVRIQVNITGICSHLFKWKVSLAHLLSKVAQFDESERICVEIIAENSKGSGILIETAVLIQALNILGEIKTERGYFSEAESIASQVLALVKEKENPHPLELAGAINNNAQIKLITRSFAKAEEMFREALMILEQEVGTEATIATVLGNLGHCLHEQGRIDPQMSYFEEAERSYRRALEIDRSVFGEEHPSYARDANNLGWFLHTIGKLEESEVLLRKALSIKESKLHKNHPAIATALSNLGRLLTTQRKCDEAIVLLKRALSINDACLGKRQHDYATVETNLAFALCENGDFDEAEKHFRETIQIDEECFGSRHPEVGRDLWNLSNFLISQRRYVEAEGFLRRALKIFEKSLGKDHLLTENIQMAIGIAQAGRALVGRRTL